MKAIIYHSMSKHGRSKKIANEIDGDHFQIIPTRKPIKFIPFQMIYYGYLTVLNKEAPINKIDIDFDKYDEIVLVSPVWAGRANAYMRQFLKEYEFHGKKVSIIGSCDGGYDKYFASFKGLIDGCNDIIERSVYVKGIKVN